MLKGRNIIKKLNEIGQNWKIVKSDIKHRFAMLTDSDILLLRDTKNEIMSRKELHFFSNQKRQILTEMCKKSIINKILKIN